MKRFKLFYWILTFIILLNGTAVHLAFGQDSFDPFAEFVDLDTSGRFLEAPSIDYTESLYDITDFGVFDERGYYVDPETLGAAVPPDEEEDNAQDVFAPPLNLDPFEAYRQSIISNWGGQRAYTERRLQSLQQNLESELGRFEDLSGTITNAEDALIPLQKEIDDLTDQINLFNEQLRITRKKIQDVEGQIAEKQVSMRGVMEDIQESKVGLKVSQQAVLDYINLLYSEEQEYLDFYADGSDTLKLLLADASVSENLMGKEYLAVMEQTGREVFHDLEASYLELREKQASLLLGQTKLKKLYTSLAMEKRLLEETRLSKKNILDETQGKQQSYEELLEESIHQQLESALAIQNIKDNIGLIEGKLDLLDEKIVEVQRSKTNLPDDTVLEDEMRALESGEELDIKGGTFFEWPVPPRAITAKFHDSTYPKRWGIHNAVDIRAPQFTPIQAPANGYVVEAKDNGMGYSYIILAHKKNLITVYGHVYDIMVEPGTLVKKGDIIGLSGGTPGTKGAGLQTTGPHLHFEVHYKGDAVNPLDYLPVVMDTLSD